MYYACVHACMRGYMHAYLRERKVVCMCALSTLCERNFIPYISSLRRAYFYTVFIPSISLVVLFSRPNILCHV